MLTHIMRAFQTKYGRTMLRDDAFTVTAYQSELQSVLLCHAQKGLKSKITVLLKMNTVFDDLISASILRRFPICSSVKTFGNLSIQTDYASYEF